jgi:hypothetical protein
MGSIVASSVSGTSEQISWQTSSVANSTVEYNTSSLFTSSISSTYSPWNYTQITHNTGVIVSSSTAVTSHSITLTGLSPGTMYYFRVQSGDSSGIVSSFVLAFGMSTIVVTLISPTNNTVTPNLTIPFSYNVTLSAGTYTNSSLYLMPASGAWQFIEGNSSAIVNDSSGNSFATVNFTGLGGAGTYYWEVQVVTSGGSAYSPVWTLTITSPSGSPQISITLTTTFLNTTSSSTFNPGNGILLQLVVNNTGTQTITNAFVEFTIQDPNSYVVYIGYAYITDNVGVQITLDSGFTLSTSATPGTYSTSVVIYTTTPWNSGSLINGGLATGTFTVT